MTAFVLQGHIYESLIDEFRVQPIASLMIHSYILQNKTAIYIYISAFKDLATDLQRLATEMSVLQLSHFCFVTLNNVLPGNISLRWKGVNIRINMI